MDADFIEIWYILYVSYVEFNSTSKTVIKNIFLNLTYLAGKGNNS